MQYELCAPYGMKETDEDPAYGAEISSWPRTAGTLAWIDNGLEWMTEKLDRKFVSAMEKSVKEDPVRKQDLNVLKRTVLALVCLGLGVTAVSIKFAIESQIIYFILG